jgi:hypothetical protein
VVNVAGILNTGRYNATAAYGVAVTIGRTIETRVHSLLFPIARRVRTMDGLGKDFSGNGK